MKSMAHDPFGSETVRAASQRRECFVYTLELLLYLFTFSS